MIPHMVSIWPKRDEQELAEEESKDLESISVLGSTATGASRGSDEDFSSARASESASRLDSRLRKILVALYVASMGVVLLAANISLVQLPDADRFALNWLVLLTGLLVAGASLFPWRRFDRNLLLVPTLVGINLIALAVYFSGGWSSPLSIFYLFAVVFCAIYFTSRLAVLCIGFVLLVSLSPELYAPDTAQLVEHAVIYAPVYLALAFASWYMRRCMLREYEISLQKAQEMEQKVQEIEDRLRRETTVDSLTNIFNRNYFEARLREEYKRAQRLDGNFAVIFLDLDDFKQINDTYGHRIGDEALRLVAHILQSNARQMDVVARYAGDEFAVLMPGTSLNGVHNFFERIRVEVAECSQPTLGFTIHLSAGVSKSTDVSDPLDLLETADEAMYRAKRQGKDQIFVMPYGSGELEPETGLEECKVRILVANEPRLYREAFASVFRMSRPYVEVIAAEHEEIDNQVSRFHPDLVICEHVTPTVQRVARSWIAVRVENDEFIATSNSSALSTRTNAELNDFLSVIDDVEEQIRREQSRTG